MDRIRMTMVAPAGREGVKHRTSEVSAVGAASLMARAGERLRQSMAWLAPRLSWHRAALGLFVLLGLVVMAIFAHYCVTWAEAGPQWDRCILFRLCVIRFKC